jgi:lipoate-protein ligase A
MAVDSAIFASVIRGESPPTLRIYRWNGAAVTVGRFQNVERGVHLDYCRTKRIPVIRRLTGGRGILHGGDQTVSIAAKNGNLGTAGDRIEDSYRLISSGFIEAFQILGIRMVVSESAPSAARGDCFAVKSVADVVSEDNGMKLVGSAQRRKDGAILQQSSIRHKETTTRPEDVFKGDSADGFPLQGVASGCLQSALRAGFERALRVKLECGLLSEREVGESARIIEGIKGSDPRRGFVDSGRGI